MEWWGGARGSEGRGTERMSREGKGRWKKKRKGECMGEGCKDTRKRIEEKTETGKKEKRKRGRDREEGREVKCGPK